MAHKRSEVPELEKMLQYGRKKFVRYDEGAKIYSMGPPYNSKNYPEAKLSKETTN